MQPIENIFQSAKFIDLTHTLDPSIPTWNGSCGFEQSIKMDYDQGCRVQGIKMHAGVGTHMDAPNHFIPNAKSIAEISLEQLIVPACVIDVSEKVTPLYVITIEDIKNYENEYGEIQPNSLVIAYTGWDKFWHTPDKYRNVNSKGMMEFPGFSVAAAELLVAKKIAGIGIDTLSPECTDMDFPVHKTILGAGGYILENLRHCDKLPKSGAYVISLPLKAEGGTESAVRAVGVVPVRAGA